MKMKLIRHTFGICPCCGRKTVFLANGYWLRDYYVCLFCRSIPRQRAIMSILKDKFPEYKNMKIHESSPSGAAFHQIKRECRNYSYSYFYDTETPGIEKADGSINENLENLTFADNTFDLFITQDVMEHVNRPERAFSEICRVLKRGGTRVHYAYLSFPKDAGKNRIGWR